MKTRTPLALLAGLAIVGASLVAAAPASAVQASYANPLATPDTSDRDITSLSVDYNASTITVTAHTQNMPAYYIFDVYFAQNPGSFSSGAMESAELSVQGTTTTRLDTYSDGNEVSQGDGSVVSWNRSGDDFTITVPSSVIPWGGDVYASATMLLTDMPSYDFHYAAIAAEPSGALTGFGPIQKGQIGTATSVALSKTKQKHGTAGTVMVANTTPVGMPGTVQFFDGAALIGSAPSSSGAASFLVPATLSSGSHAIHAAFFPADTNFAISISGPVGLKIVSTAHSTKTAVHLSSSVQRYKKSSVRVTVKLSSKHASGKVILYQGKKKITSATLKKGRAHLTIRKSLSTGTHKLTVKYVPKNPEAYKTSRSRTFVVRVVR